MPLWKKLLYAALLSLGALALLLGSAELFLRAIGYGHDTAFSRRETITSPDQAPQTILRDNRWVTAPYFAPELIRWPQPFRVPAEKSPDTCRIFVLGSSAAMGDPQASFSIARMLQVMLHHAHPEKKFEVINAGITAINSHVVREIAADCARLQPDLFIVYEGNNEVIGPYGPGTVFSPFFQSTALVRLSIALRKSRLGQWLGTVVRRFKKNAPQPGDWGGMAMFLKHEIADDDPRLRQTAEHFRANLAAIVASARSAHADAILCTVLTNQRDFAPFRSKHRADLTPADLTRWDQAYATGQAAFLAKNLPAAETAYRAALAIDDQHAELHFRLARLCLAAKRLDEAKQHFQRALDLDALRFRTDSRLNQVIRDTARSENATLVDLAELLAAESADGILGKEFLYEHVHLNPPGTLRVCQKLFPAIDASLRQRGLVSAGAPTPSFDISNVLHPLGFTHYEMAKIYTELEGRFLKVPFTLQADNDQRLREVRELLDFFMRRLNAPDGAQKVFATYEHALQLNPSDWILHRNFGMALVANQRFAEAVPHLQATLAQIPDETDALAALAMAQTKTDDTAAAQKTYDLLRILEPRHPALPSAVNSAPQKMDAR